MTTPETEPHSVALRFPITIGTPALLSARERPCDRYLRGRTVKTNAPQPGFAFVSDLKVGNVDTLCGSYIDAWAMRNMSDLDLPTMTPGTALVFEGQYSGLVPEGFKKGDKFEFEVTVEGIGMMTEDA